MYFLYFISVCLTFVAAFCWKNARLGLHIQIELLTYIVRRVRPCCTLNKIENRNTLLIRDFRDTFHFDFFLKQPFGKNRHLEFFINECFIIKQQCQNHQTGVCAQPVLKERFLHKSHVIWYQLSTRGFVIKLCPLKWVFKLKSTSFFIYIPAMSMCLHGNYVPW